MTQDINETLPELLGKIRELAENGKYREKKELIPVVENLAWFDNFSEQFYNERIELLESLKDEVQN